MSKNNSAKQRKEAMSELLIELKRKISRKYHNLNCGGCGIVAYLVANRLQAHFPVRIAVEGYNHNSKLEKAREEMNNFSRVKHWENEGVTFAHIVAEVRLGKRWYTFDASKGLVLSSLFWEDGGGKHLGFMSLKELKLIAYDRSPHAWNNMFNSEQIPSLRSSINSFFNKVDKQLVPVG